MADYNKWTKEALIKRVRHLENEAKHGTQNGLPQRAPIIIPESVESTTASNYQNGDAETSLQPDKLATRKPKKPRSMDHSKYATRFIALKLAYFGKNYNGFEYQCTGALSTIEEELWKALVKSCLVSPNPDKPDEVDWTVCEYSKCGRTDRGVSAFGQVVALRVRSNKLAKRQAAAPTAAGEGPEAAAAHVTAPAPDGKDAATEEAAETGQEEDDDDDAPLPIDQEIQYCRVLNRILPTDIRVYAWAPNPPPDFSARFSCRERQYRYFFTQPAFAPLPNFLEKDPGSTADGTTTTKPKTGWLDIAAMRTAAKHFEGLHDFRNFCKIDPSKQLTNFDRRVFEASIVEVDGLDSTIPYLSAPPFRDPNPHAAQTPSPKIYYFHVRGSAFLWHQIRCMVAVLFLVGQGHESPDVVAQLLDAAANPRRPNYVLADDTPLVLWDCLFGRDRDEGSPDQVDWVYVGGAGDNPLSLHGGNGLAGDLWAVWREKKMDEILANRLLDWVSRKTAMGEEVQHRDVAERPAKGRANAVTSSAIYEGGNRAKLSGAWVPIMKKERALSPEEMNDKYAVRKGFKNAEEMRALGNWRDAIRETKEKEEAATLNATEK